MTSILTNTAAMSALSNLTATQRDLTKTQAQVSSGLAVGTASDNAAYWSIGQTMSAQVAGLDAVQKSLELTQAIAEVTSQAIASIMNSVKQIKSDLVSAQSSGMNSASLQSDIKAQQQSIITIANSASFNGVNWLVGKSSTNKVTSDIRHFDTDFATSQEALDQLGSNTYNEYCDYSVTTAGTDAEGNTVSLVDSENGYWTMSSAGVAAHFTSSTSDANSTADATTRIITSEGSQGLQFYSIDSGKLSLFSKISGSTEKITHVDYTDGHASDSDVSSTSSVYGSYLTPSVTGGGILDGSIGTTGNSILNFDVTLLSVAAIQSVAAGVDSIISRLVTAGGVVGSIQSTVLASQTFNTALSDSLTAGIGSLVDADMNVASTRLQALQTQQQLGIQALSMANQNSLLVLKLFQAA